MRGCNFKCDNFCASKIPIVAQCFVIMDRICVIINQIFGVPVLKIVEGNTGICNWLANNFILASYSVLFIPSDCVIWLFTSLNLKNGKIARTTSIPPLWCTLTLGVTCLCVLPSIGLKQGKTFNPSCSAICIRSFLRLVFPVQKRS
jgi:hypothetical protein